MRIGVAKVDYYYKRKNTHYYQRHYPSRLHPYCAARGIGICFKTMLPLDADATPAEIHKSVEIVNQDFELHLKAIEAANADALTEQEYLRAALFKLKTHLLPVGSLYLADGDTTAKKEIIAKAEDGLLQTVFSDLEDWHKNEVTFAYTYSPDSPDKALNQYELEQAKPANIKLLETAWKLLTTPAKSKTKSHTFSDAWQAYALEKRQDSTEKRNKRMWEKTISRWQDFLAVVGDQLFTQDNINKAIATYYKHEKGRPSKSSESCIKDSSVKRNLGVPKAVLRYFNDLELYGFVITSPIIKGSSTRSSEFTLNQDKQIELVKALRTESMKGYAHWKELFILISLISGTYASELQRATRDQINLKNNPPYFVVSGDTKTEYRQRVVPISVFKDRIAYLLEKTDDGSNTLLGSHYSQLDESAISKALSGLTKQIDLRAVPRSLRHSLAHNCQVAGLRSEDTAQLGGWAAGTLGLNPVQFMYGRQGRGDNALLSRLAEAASDAHKHLEDL